jgi:hypothetical protein
MSEPTPSDTEQPPARSSTYLRSGVVALVVVAAIGFVINLLVLQRHTNPTVDGHEIAQLISQGIQANSGIATPPQVACPLRYRRANPASTARWRKTRVG